jgi:hypothetical protein
MRVRWVGHVTRVQNIKHAYKRLVKRPERKINFVRRRWEGNIKVDLKEIDWDDINYVLFQDGSQ